LLFTVFRNVAIFFLLNSKFFVSAAIIDYTAVLMLNRRRKPIFLLSVFEMCRQTKTWFPHYPPYSRITRLRENIIYLACGGGERLMDGGSIDGLKYFQPLIEGHFVQ
jgi:hypothetical protein